MQDRTSLILQAVIAFCMWALVVLNFGGRLIELRIQALSQGLGSIPGSTLAVAALLVVLEVVLLAFAIYRVYQSLRTPARRDI